MTRGAAFAVALWAAIAGGCATGEATEIMLTIERDLHATEMNAVLVRVFYLREEPGPPGDATPEGPGRPRDLMPDEAIVIGGREYEHRFSRVFPAVAPETFPIEIGVAPRGGDPTRVAYFEAFALRCTDPSGMTDCAVVTETAGRAAFVPRRRVRLALWLSAGCAGVTCADGEVCRIDACRPPDLPSQCLIDADADAGSEPFVCAIDLAPCREPVVFSFTETPEPFVVPNRVRFMLVKAWGAGGNDERQCGATPDGGTGGFTEAVFEVVAGTELLAIVGKRGRAGVSGEDIVRFGFGAWGGGGLTGLFRGAEPITELDRDRAMVIAGGGGSASAPGCHPGIPGNHPSAGGQPTMMGEAPATGSPVGGGGGHSGGVAGTSSAGAAGGTGHVAPDAVRGRVLYSEPGTNRPPRDDDADYAAGAGASEASGHLVVHYLCDEPLF